MERPLLGIPEPERSRVRAAALALLQCGAYSGTETDAVTDAQAILQAAGTARRRGRIRRDLPVRY